MWKWAEDRKRSLIVFICKFVHLFVHTHANTRTEEQKNSSACRSQMSLKYKNYTWRTSSLLLMNNACSLTGSELLAVTPSYWLKFLLWLVRRWIMFLYFSVISLFGFSSHIYMILHLFKISLSRNLKFV